VSGNAVLRSIAALAPGKRVTVIVRGRAHELPVVPEAHPVAPERDVGQEFLERNAQTAEAVEGAVRNIQEVVREVGASVGAINAALERLAAEQSEAVSGIKGVVAALARPVRPVYDKVTGRLVGAVRDAQR